VGPTGTRSWKIERPVYYLLHLAAAVFSNAPGPNSSTLLRRSSYSNAITSKDRRIWFLAVQRDKTGQPPALARRQALTTMPMKITVIAAPQLLRTGCPRFLRMRHWHRLLLRSRYQWTSGHSFTYSSSSLYLWTPLQASILMQSRACMTILPSYW